MPVKRRGPTLSGLFGSAYDDPNFALYQTDLFRNFRDLLDAWITHEVGNGPIRETGDPFLEKTGLGKVLTQEQLTQLVREEKLPGPQLTAILAMHLPGAALRRDEDPIPEINPSRLRKRARYAARKGSNGPVLELSDTAFRQFRKQFLDELQAARQPGGLPPEPDERTRAIWDCLFAFFTAKAEASMSGETQETIRAKLASLYKKNPANMMALVGEVTGGEVTGQEVQRFFSDFIVRPLPPAAQALAFLRNSMGIAQSQEQLGAFCNVADDVISNWETGKTLIPLNRLPQLVHALELTTEETDRLSDLMRPTELSDTELHAQPKDKQAGFLLRHLRENRNLSQEKLGVLCKVTHETISNWERGRKRIPLNQVPQLAHALELTTEEADRLSDLMRPAELSDTELHAQPKDKQAGFLLCHLRKSRNLFQKELGAFCKVTNDTILNWEKGLNPIPLDQVPQLAHAMKLTTEETKRLSELVRPAELSDTKLHAQPKDKQAGFLLCHMRKSSNLLQKELGAFCNVAQETISNWERGTKHIPLDQVPQLAHALKLTAKETGRLSELVQLTHERVLTIKKIDRLLEPVRQAALPDARLNAQPPDKQAGLVLCHLRESRGISQVTLARSRTLGVTAITIRQWENGDPIPPEKIPVLTRVLELDEAETASLQHSLPLTSETSRNEQTFHRAGVAYGPTRPANPELLLALPQQRAL